MIIISQSPAPTLSLIREADGLFFFAVAEAAPADQAPAPAPTPAPAAPQKETFAKDKNGAVRIKADVAGMVIENRWLSGAYRAVETDMLKDPVTGKYEIPVKTPNLVIRGVKIEEAFRDGIRLRHADGLLIENFEIRHGAHKNTGEDLPEGIAITRAHDFLIRNGVVSGFQMEPTYDAAGKPKYINGDGIATEADVTGRIVNVTSTDNSDGGFDLKGDVVVDNCTALRNSRGFRFWKLDPKFFPNKTERRAGTITTDSTTWLSSGAEIVIDKLVVVGSGEIDLLTVEGGAKATIKAVDLSGFTGKVRSLVRANGSGNTINWPAGFKAP